MFGIEGFMSACIILVLHGTILTLFSVAEADEYFINCLGKKYFII